MNVLGTVRRVVGKLPLLTEDEDEEPNLYKRMLLKEIKTFDNPTVTLDDKEKALAKIGHISYTADHECREHIAGFVHKLIKIIGDTKEPLSLRLQSIRTLSEMCHFNKFIIDKTWKSVRFSQIIPDVVGDLHNPLVSRWSCYLVSVMVAHSIAFLKEFDRMPRFVEALEKTASFEHEWRGFGFDIANHLLVLSGRKPKTVQPTPQQTDKENTEDKETVDKSTSEETIVQTVLGTNIFRCAIDCLRRGNQPTQTEKKQGEQSESSELQPND